MTGEGIVSAVDGAFVTVSVKQQTACEGCHGKDSCTSCSSMIAVRARNDCGASVGDRVEVTEKTGRVLFYAFAVFLVPLFVGAGAYFAADAIAGNMIVSVISAFAALILSYFVLRLTLDKRAEKRCDRSASKILEKAKEIPGEEDT